MAAKPCSAYLIDLPLTGYREILRFQREAVAARRDGRLDRNVVILVEHPPVFTLGRRGGRENLRVAEATLEAQGIEVVAVERGGDITYHGPGQLVVYPLVDLNAGGLQVVDFVDILERTMIATAARWHVTARGDRVNRGAWVGGRKLGSVGITVRRGVTLHGLALNVTTDLTPFGWINPCGMATCTMTTLVREAGRTVSMADVRRVMARQIAQLLQLDLQPVDMTVLSRQLGS
ncbi:MAG: lipoyl(octanoyl) transferase LipB [Desulfatitalea sp.]|nr:lipoyl(octanoyl) transferase LipB [Desulfatitalea sp.]